MPDIQNRHLEAFSEEVQEIMGHVPRWIVRWGITVFFLIFMSILAGSYFFKYPRVVSTPFVLTTIIPHEETIIIARAYVPSSGLGKVAAGQEVNIKLSGFPYMEYGILKGKVNTISEVPEASGYVAEIELVKGMESAYGEKLRFIQHMDGTADIITEETRLVHRFINPLKAIINN